MKTLFVRWEVTEQHEASVDVDDDFDPAEIDSDMLAEYEDGSSYAFTSDRSILEVEVSG